MFLILSISYLVVAIFIYMILDEIDSRKVKRFAGYYVDKTTNFMHSIFWLPYYATLYLCWGIYRVGSYVYDCALFVFKNIEKFLNFVFKPIIKKIVDFIEKKEVG